MSGSTRHQKAKDYKIDMSGTTRQSAMLKKYQCNYVQLWFPFVCGAVRKPQVTLITYPEKVTKPCFLLYQLTLIDLLFSIVTLQKVSYDKMIDRL